MITLSICIPTYNRQEYLGDCLNSVIDSVEGYENEIEVIVLDNASTDNTSGVVKEFEKHKVNIWYFNNPECIDASHNQYAAAKLGNGKYVWILADDDKIDKFAVLKVLNIIRQDYSLIVMNHEIWTKGFEQIIVKSALKFKNNFIISDHNKLLSTLGLRLGFISGYVIKKELLFIITKEEFDKYIEYGFSVMYAVYVGIVKECKAYIISEALIKQRSGNSSYDTLFWYKCFAIGSSKIFAKLKDYGYSKNAEYRAKNLVLSDYIFKDISFRRRNDISVKGVFMYLCGHYKLHLYFWIICVPILFAPKICVVSLRSTVLSLKNKKY